jgi:penicillin-binding protein 1C
MRKIILKIPCKKTILFFLAAFFLIYMIIPLPSPFFAPDYSTVILDENGKILRVFLNQEEQWCLPPDKNLKMPEKLKKTVLMYEDRYFYEHPGVNPVALGRALFQNISAGRTVSGASTLTMQVARLIKPKERTYWNKLLEIFQALKIEINFSKDEILQFYLNHAPYGGNIIGFQAASLRYFQKMPENLTWGEAATLAVLPNSPGLISPDMNSQLLKNKRDRLLKTLLEQRIITEETYHLSLLESLPERSTPFPMLAPHLGQYLKVQYRGNGGIIRTTLKSDIQQRAEEMVRRHLQYLQQKGIQNGAVLIAETQSGKIKAYVGSQDFFDFETRGQVDGVRAPRSSGSLLKPFLYALCIDEGIILPETLVRDVPTFYGSFSPSNADEKYDGIVSAKDALVRSLNVPAVRLLYTHGVYPFYLFLKSTGFSTLFRFADDYGLPLILGGAETTVWDMAMLFRGLANEGKFTSLSVWAEDGKEKVKNDEKTGAVQGLISPMACYLTLNMLKELKRPGVEYYWEQYQNQWPLAWKTGTSYGQRDAWAVGVSPQWTIAVWVGNFSGEGNANLAGSRCAGPLLFEIFNYLPKDPQYSWFVKPQNDATPVEICRETGFLAGDDCPATLMAEAPSFAKPLRQCPIHHRIYLSEDDKYEVCSLCWEPGQYHFQQRLVYPPDVVQFLRERGQVIYDIPPHHPGCPAQSSLTAVQILYPRDNARLWVPREFDGTLQKVTFRVAHRESKRTIFWYLDNTYLGNTINRHEKAIDLSPAGRGWHMLEVVDEIGYRDRNRFYVDMRE